MRSCTIYQKNDIYSGLGEDSSTSSSTSEPKESKAKQEREEQYEKVEETSTNTQHAEGGGTEGASANDKQKSDGAPGDSARLDTQTNASGGAVQPPQTDDDRWETLESRRFLPQVATLTGESFRTQHGIHRHVGRVEPQ